jgi:hypothetical protein
MPQEKMLDCLAQMIRILPNIRKFLPDSTGAGGIKEALDNPPKANAIHLSSPAGEGFSCPWRTA